MKNDVKEMKEYIKSIQNINTKIAVTAVYNSLKNYSNKNKKNIDSMNANDIEDFIIKTYNGLSETTIANVITNIKKLFEQIGKRDMLRQITFLTMKEKVSARPIKVYTPSELFDIVEDLNNYQDKALVILVYLGLYDKDFLTIRQLKEYEIYEDKIVTNNQTIRINIYIYEIMQKAMNEETYRKYGESAEFNLKMRNGYLMRGKKSTIAAKEYVSAIMLKKRFENIGKYFELEDFTPVTLKNSKLVYDLVKLELDYNNGMNINQLLLIDYVKDNNKKGCIEKLNVAKKEIKEKIIEDIVQGNDILCR